MAEIHRQRLVGIRKHRFDIVLLGPPGSGKGTQADLLSAKYGITHVNTGELLRALAEEPTQVGEAVRHFLENGLMVPEGVVTRIIEERLSSPDCERGFILDGYPRTASQMVTFDHLLQELGREVFAVIYIEVPDSVCLARLSTRRVCSGCSAVKTIPGGSHQSRAACERCGGRLIRRPDDRPEVVVRRLALFSREIAPVIAKFEREGLLARVDGRNRVNDVFEQITRAIKRKLTNGKS